MCPGLSSQHVGPCDSDADSSEFRQPQTHLRNNVRHHGADPSDIIIPPLTRETFIRVSRAFFLKRVQDIQEVVTGVRPGNYLQMVTGINIPQLISELLYSLRSVRSTAPYGYYISILPASLAQTTPNWWTFGEDNLENFITFTSMTKDRYMNVTFLKWVTWTEDPMFCYKHEQNDVGNVKLYTDDAPKSSDIYLLFIYEEMFVNPPFVYEEHSNPNIWNPIDSSTVCALIHKVKCVVILIKTHYWCDYWLYYSWKLSYEVLHFYNWEEEF